MASPRKRRAAKKHIAKVQEKRKKTEVPEVPEEVGVGEEVVKKIKKKGKKILDKLLGKGKKKKGKK